MLKFIIHTMLLNLLIAEENFVSFEIVTYDNPYQEKLFIHTFGGEDKYMSIFNPNLQPYWQINSDEKGLDFKKHFFVANLKI